MLRSISMGVSFHVNKLEILGKNVWKRDPDQSQILSVQFIYRTYSARNYKSVGTQVAQARNMSIGGHRHCCVTFKI